jgi:chromodomain-helicase-DNA-binding protein 7
MSVRYNMVQIKRLHESLLEASSTQLLSDNQRAVKMLTDQKGKSILDNFIMLKINESQIESLDEHNMCKSFMDEAPDKLEKKSHLNELKFKNLKLIKNQLLCKNWLLQAFVQNRNVILADEKGLGKTVTLLVFLNHLKSQYKIDGPFLVITSQEKLEHWRHLAEKWTSLKTLVYYDSDPDLQKGLAQLRKWVFFKKDVTIKGKFTERSQLFKFEMLITTAEVIQSDAEQVLKKVPFLQIIVDDAEDPKKQQALDYFACKRFILATSNPIPHQINDLWNILEIIDPAFFSNESQKHFLSGKILSVQCIRQLFELSRPYILRHKAPEAEPLLNNFDEVVLNIEMTKP